MVPALAPLNLMKHVQIGSVTAAPRKYFKKPDSFSVMDINVDIRGGNVAQRFYLKLQSPESKELQSLL